LTFRTGWSLLHRFAVALGVNSDERPFSLDPLQERSSPREPLASARCLIARGLGTGGLGLAVRYRRFGSRNSIKNGQFGLTRVARVEAHPEKAALNRAELGLTDGSQPAGRLVLVIGVESSSGRSNPWPGHISWDATYYGRTSLERFVLSNVFKGITPWRPRSTGRGGPIQKVPWQADFARSASSCSARTASRSWPPVWGSQRQPGKPTRAEPSFRLKCCWRWSI